MTASRRKMDVRYRQVTLTDSIARSGLTDATSWFQRQTSQPVVAFSPSYDPTGDPPLNDTLDPAVGLVREFEVRGSLWGRYEVRNAEALDVSSSHGFSSPGAVWDLGARGILYERVDPGIPFDQAPNRVVAVTNLRSQLRGIRLQTPAEAAVVTSDPDNVFIYGDGKVDGGDAHPAVAFNSADGVFPVTTEGTVAGTPSSLPLGSYFDAADQVFEMRLDQLKAFADIVTDGSTGLPTSEIVDKVIVVNGNLTFGAGRSQRGRMLLVVTGDFAALQGNETRMSGVIYVQGDASIEGPFELNGMLISQGTVKVGTSGGGNPVVLRYDASAVNALRTALLRYRRSRAVRPSPPGKPYVESTDIDAARLEDALSPTGLTNR